MSLLYDRIAQINVGTASGETLQIKDLRISFSIEKSIYSETKSTNLSKLTIYNLSKPTRNAITEIDDLCIVQVGYKEQGLTTIFAGDIKEVSHNTTPPDITTILNLGDGYTTTRESYSNVSFKEDTNIKTVLQKIVGDLKLSTKNFDFNEIKDFVFKGGFQASAPTRDVLNDLSKTGDFEWSIQNDRLKITSKNVTTGDAIVFLTPKSGLIDTPERITFIEDGQNQKKGWKLRTLLMPTILPGDFVAVQSKEIERKTAFRVVDIRHDGDTHGPDWTSTIRVQIV